ncbi:MAG: pseudouridine synthase [Prochlorococcus sp.]
MTQQRLQKLIAAAGLCSRRHAEQLLLKERVRINGLIAKLGDKADPEIDNISVDGVPLIPQTETKVLLLNKPAGVITSCHDPYGRPTVLSLLPITISKGLHPVGRLDADSRGALLITNHGELTLRLTHPRYAHAKTYQVLVQGKPSDITLAHWRDGVMLDKKTTLPTELELLQSDTNQSLLKVVLREGRNRQIRRVADQLGHPVIDLQRTAIANIALEALAEGSWRELSEREWEPLLKVAQHSPH